MKSERDSIILKNRGIIKQFIRKYVTRRLARLLGGADVLLADMYEPYVLAIDRWLKNDRKYDLRFVIWRALGVFMLRTLRRHNLITSRCNSLTKMSKSWRARVASKATFHAINVTSERIAYDQEITEEETAAARTLVEKLLRRLPSNKQDIIRMRFGIGCQPQTLGSIAEQLDLTKERIRQIVVKSLYWLTESLNDAQWKEFTSLIPLEHNEPRIPRERHVDKLRYCCRKPYRRRRCDQKFQVNPIPRGW